MVSSTVGYGFMAAFTAILVLVSVMDLRHGRIPDSMVLLGLILGLIAAALQGTLLSGVVTGAGTFLGFMALALVYHMGMRIVAMTIATTLSIFLVLWFLSR